MDKWSLFLLQKPVKRNNFGIYINNNNLIPSPLLNFLDGHVLSSSVFKLIELSSYLHNISYGTCNKPLHAHFTLNSKRALSCHFHF